MSTPSTATITVPPNHQYFHKSYQQRLPPINPDYRPQSPYLQHQQHHPHHHHHHPPQPPPHQDRHFHHQSSHFATDTQAGHTNDRPLPYAQYYTTGPPPPAHHRGESNHSSRPPQMSSPYAHESATSPRVQPSRQKSKKPVDWKAFYNGKTPDVITIDDDDESPQDRQPTDQQPHQRQHQQHHHSTTDPSRQQQQQQQYSYSGPVDDRRHAGHTDKRQRIASSTSYNPVYQQHSSTNTPQYAQSPSTQAACSDRTASYQNTTAPTSLGSSSSGGNLAQEPQPGQKRKRSTRQVVAKSAPRPLRDPYADYHAPPHPPYKATDVVVPKIKDYSSRRNQAIDDDDGHFKVELEADLTQRYIVKEMLGQGTFGRVVKAYDRQRNSYVAIKIIRAVQKYRDASKIELRVLSTLAHNDRSNRNKCIHLRDTFDFRSHICIVTDLLGQSVFDFLKNNAFVPFPSSQIQSFARQLFTSIAFLHDLNLVHTDLKPENILLVNNAYQTFTYNRNIPSASSLTTRSAKLRRVLLEPEIRLIDFGSATFEDEYHSTVVSTRHYRAPEIYLNIGWSFPCDIWSIGCILVEFFTGDALFQTHEDLEHLAMMEAVCGAQIDKSIIRQVTHGGRSNKNSAASFFKRQTLDYPREDTARQSRKFVKAMRMFEEFIPAHASPFNRQFLDLLRRIFIYDPSRRITAKQALQHPWFREQVDDDGTEAGRILESKQRDAAAALAAKKAAAGH